MIEIKNLTGGYGRTDVLHGIDLALDGGKLTSIIGPNGSGKSTLLKMLIGILRSSGGEVFIDGARTSELSQKEIAKRVAYLPQGRRTPDMTVLSAVLHGRFPHLGYPRRYTERDREIAFAAMERAGVAELADRRLDTLSGGMKQSAYIAMALAQDTDYILLDEPTAHLDISHQLRLMELLAELAAGGRGIIAVMHDLPLALSYSDRIALLDNGRVAAEGTPDELADGGDIKRVLGVELLKSDNGGYSLKI